MTPVELQLWETAAATALKLVDGNIAPFALVYPDDASIGNMYHPRKARPGLAEGSNFDWTPGFWPGQLWLAYDLTGDPRYRAAGEGHVASFAWRIEQKYDCDTHDLGFLYTPTCVAPWKVTGNRRARQAAMMAAEYLMTRFLEKPGIFQAWGRMDDAREGGRTILDSVMNMPLLYWASQETGDARFAAAAHRHTCQLRDTFIRADASTYHTYYFDVASGRPLYGKQAGGATEDSCWARGQAWAMYGFPLNYRYTHDESFLASACRVSDYFLAHLPADGVPYWDFSFSAASGEARDSSAAAIAVCGLLELARLLPPGSQSERYHHAALEILNALCRGYAAPADGSSNGLLLHGVYGGASRHGYDECNLWGDYYYLEALVRVLKPDWQLYW